MGNARHCGCDPDCQPKAYYCRDYPDCVYGREMQLDSVGCGGVCQENDDCERICARPVDHHGRCACKNHV